MPVLIIKYRSLKTNNHVDYIVVLFSTTLTACESDTVPENGYIIADNGLEVSYGCDVNFTMDGERVRMCSSEEAGWLGIQPSCGMFCSRRDFMLAR